MFGLFKSKSEGIQVRDKIWMSKRAKLNACSELLKLNPGCLFAVWFKGSFNELETHLQLTDATQHVVMANDLSIDRIQNRMLVFAEHYPLAHVEQSLYQRLELKEVPVLFSLDEPFFAKFGGEKTIALMKKLGLKEDEVVAHNMVSKSIRRAQEKLGEKVKVERSASSQEEWFSLNIENRILS